MAKIMKVELLIDLSAPVQEVAEVVSLMLQTHPGRQIEILRAIDEQIGKALIELETTKPDQPED